MKKSRVKIKPKRASLNDFILTETCVETAEQNKEYVTSTALLDELFALQRRAKALHFCPILASEFKAITRILAVDPPDSDTPVEKAAQDHGVTVGGSGAVSVQDGAVIALNVAGGDKSGGKL